MVDRHQDPFDRILSANRVNSRGNLSALSSFFSRSLPRGKLIIFHLEHLEGGRRRLMKGINTVMNKGKVNWKDESKIIGSFHFILCPGTIFFSLSPSFVNHQAGQMNKNRLRFHIRRRKIEYVNWERFIAHVHRTLKFFLLLNNFLTHLNIRTWKIWERESPVG